MQAFRPLLLGATICCSALAACPMYALAEPIAPEAGQGAGSAATATRCATLKEGTRDFLGLGAGGEKWRN